jgi:alanyl-tRNA synthetase
VRRVTRRVASMTDDARAEAQSFTAGGKAIFLLAAEQPPAVLLAASPDSGVNAGEVLKTVLAKVGGRGGGSTTMAQGSVPSKELLEDVVKHLES